MRNCLKYGLQLAIVGALASSAAAAHAAIVVDFENVAEYPNGSDVLINGFYNGGTASNGASGPNVGVQFTGSATLLCLNTPDDDFCSNASRGVAGPSDKGAMYWTGGSPVVNLAAGFTGFAFVYADVVGSTGIAIYDGLNGTGSLLASASFGTTPEDACDGDFSGGAAFCPFVNGSLNFTGLGRSVVFTSGANEAVFDDLTFGATVPPPSVPEPASWAMMLAGFGAIGAALRRRGWATARA